MPADKSAAEHNLDALIREGFTAILKPLGFKKSRLNFHRRRGDVVQVVNVQQSQWTAGGDKVFYVNVGLAFDSICKLIGAAISEDPKEYECDQLGMRQRLEELIKSVPAQWTVPESESKLTEVTARLRAGVSQLASELDKIEDVRTYREHPWFARSESRPLNAQVLYLLGDLDGAWNVIQQICTSFAGRRLLDQPRHWIHELKLVKLKPRVG